MKATQATPTKLSRRSRSGRWEGALVFADEVGDGEEGLSPAPEGAAICCRVFMILSVAGEGEGPRPRKILGFDCVASIVWEGGGQGGVSRSEGEVWCALQQQNHMLALLQLQHKQGE